MLTQRGPAPNRKKTTRIETRLRNEIKALRLVGGQMSNVCYNWSQSTGKLLDSLDKNVLSKLYQAWDGIKRS